MPLSLAIFSASAEIGFVRLKSRDSPRVETSNLRKSGGRRDPPASYDQRVTAPVFTNLEIRSEFFASRGEAASRPVARAGRQARRAIEIFSRTLVDA